MVPREIPMNLELDEQNWTYLQPLPTKSYNNNTNNLPDLTLEEIAKLPDPYFDDSLHIDEKNIKCVNCYRNEQNIEIYRKLNRKSNLQIYKLKSEKTKLSKNIKALQQQNRNLIKKLTDLRAKTKTKLPEIIDKQNKSGNSKIFCKMLLLERKKMQKWADEFKNLAQNIYYRSPKAYTFMRDHLQFELPSKSSLIRWQPIKNVSPGNANHLI